MKLGRSARPIVSQHFLEIRRISVRLSFAFFRQIFSRK